MSLGGRTWRQFRLLIRRHVMVNHRRVRAFWSTQAKTDPKRRRRTEQQHRDCTEGPADQRGRNGCGGPREMGIRCR
jgi:hypothetical protein